MKKELIEIVDDKGNFTGDVLEKEEAHKKNLLHNEVGCFIINNKGQILLEKRSPNKKYSPNKWGLCAGHVDAGETLKTAMVREIKEEIGLTVTENDLIPFGEREFTIEDTNSHITYFFYLKCNLKEEDFRVQEEELSEVKWFFIEDVINKIKSNDKTTVFKERRLYLLELLDKELEKDIKRAHVCCTNNKNELMKASQCGCFYCLNIFTPKEITNWCDNGNTALCPYCGIDSILYDNPIYPLNSEFLEKMNKYWF